MADDGKEDEQIASLGGICRCWCGAAGLYDDLFNDDLDETCGGTGVLHCYCGGDQCVCHNHGEVQCHGCEDCEDDDGDWDWDEDY